MAYSLRGFFSTLESGFIKLKYPDSLWIMEFARCVWKEAVSGKKKLRIQKYPVMYERTLSLSKKNHR